MPRDVDPVWVVATPRSWPDGPETMSYSTLVELEECPRRWALRSAEYPDIWDGRGYPAAATSAALEGSVVHRTLETLTRAFARDQVPSLADESAITTLKRLGGYSKVIAESVESMMQGVRKNPRASARAEDMARRLLARVPHMRSRVQGLVSRIQLSSAEGEARIESEPAGEPGTFALSQGSHSEVELQASEVGWRGVADLITIEADCIEIRDFKTGSPKESHALQIKIYAWLWANDVTQNPARRLAERLIVSYDTHDKEFPAPSADELVTLEGEVRERTDRARQAIASRPPEARPSPERCAYCGVRQLCDEYWATGNDDSKDDREGFLDLQLRLTAKHGPSSWDGVVTLAPTMRKGSEIVLRVSNLCVDLHVGQEVRVLGVHVSSPEHGDLERSSSPAIATMGSESEIYLVFP